MNRNEQNKNDKIVDFQAPQKDTLTSRYLYPIGPVLWFILIYEIILAGLQTIMLQVAVENANWQIYTSQHAGTISTASMAAAMTLASMPFWKRAYQEILAFHEDWDAARSFGGFHMRRMADLRSDRLIYAALFVGAICLSIGSNIFLSLLFQTRNVLAEHDTAATIILQILVFGFLTPLFEEAMFRGIGYARIKSVANSSRRRKRETIREVMIAAGFTAILFGLYHANLRQGIYAAIMGLAFAIAYEIVGNFPGIWLMHGACNVITVLMSAQFVVGQNTYTMLVTPVWGAAFVATAAVCFYAIWLQMNRMDPHRRGRT